MSSGGFSDLAGSSIWSCVFITVQPDGKVLIFLAPRAKASAGV